MFITKVGNDKVLENEIKNNSEIKCATVRKVRDDYEGKIVYNGRGGFGEMEKMLVSDSYIL